MVLRWSREDKWKFGDINDLWNVNYFHPAKNINETNIYQIVEESGDWDRYDGATDSAIIILVRSEKHNEKNFEKFKRLLETEMVINLIGWISWNNE